MDNPAFGTQDGTNAFCTHRVRYIYGRRGTVMAFDTRLLHRGTCRKIAGTPNRDWLYWVYAKSARSHLTERYIHGERRIFGPG